MASPTGESNFGVWDVEIHCCFHFSALHQWLVFRKVLQQTMPLTVCLTSGMYFLSTSWTILEIKYTKIFRRHLISACTFNTSDANVFGVIYLRDHLVFENYLHVDLRHAVKRRIAPCWTLLWKSDVRGSSYDLFLSGTLAPSWTTVKNVKV